MSELVTLCGRDKVKEVDSKVRVEMMRTVRESEDFYQKEIESLKVGLHSEREKASALHLFIYFTYY